MTRQLAVAREGARPPEDGEEEPVKARMLLKEDFSSSSSSLRGFSGPIGLCFL